MLEDLRRELIALVHESAPNPELRTRMMTRFDLALARRLTSPSVADRFARLLDRYGWPAAESAGEDAAQAAFQLAMLCAPDDCAIARRAAELLSAAVKRREAARSHEAMLIDRIRLLEGGRQLLGTQYDWGEDGELRPLPIADLVGLEAVRHEAGLPKLGDDTRRERLAAADNDERAPQDLEAHHDAQRQRATAAGWSEADELTEPTNLSQYDARWPAFFFDEARHVAQIFGVEAAAIEHIGSTAVPGLDAKPIVDILVGLRGPLTAEHRDALELGGYEPRANTSRYSLRGDKNFDLYVVQYGAHEWTAALALRDFLRAHPQVAKSFGEHKRRMIHAGARTSAAYAERKGPWLLNLLERARSWAAIR